LERGPEKDIKNEAGLGLAIHSVQQALISAYEDTCPLRPVKTGRQSLKWTVELESFRREVRRLFNKWTVELESLRREVRQLFNKCRSDKNPHSWEL
jgi:hypothetical protein